MDIEKKYNENELTLYVKGRVDTIMSKDLEKTVNDEISKFNPLILDLTDLEYISSAGLRILITIQKKLKTTDVPFIIKNVNDKVREIFRTSGFDKILTIE